MELSSPVRPAFGCLSTLESLEIAEASANNIIWVVALTNSMESRDMCLLGKTLFGWKYFSHGSEPIVVASQGKRYVIVSESP
ncbi:hypothetical protein D5086_032063 [Populus alba]|uniref:Uncharacterized protein n=1 Tax=Populus alba TaxID=43335 RepID=A0ACC4AKC1_POPAL